MKKLLILIGALLAVSVTSRAQFTMNAGDTFVYHFDSLQYQGTAITFPLGGQYNLLLNPATVDSGDSLRMELFEGDITGTAVAEITVTPGTEVPYLVAETAWADLEGSIRVTALSGSFTVNQVDIIRRTEAPGGVDLFQVTLVPEPSTTALAVLGAVLLGGGTLKRRLGQS